MYLYLLDSALGRDWVDDSRVVCRPSDRSRCICPFVILLAMAHLHTWKPSVSRSRTGRLQAIVTTSKFEHRRIFARAGYPVRARPGYSKCETSDSWCVHTKFTTHVSKRLCRTSGTRRASDLFPRLHYPLQHLPMIQVPGLSQQRGHNLLQSLQCGVSPRPVRVLVLMQLASSSLLYDMSVSTEQVGAAGKLERIGKDRRSPARLYEEWGEHERHVDT